MVNFCLKSTQKLLTALENLQPWRRFGVVKALIKEDKDLYKSKDLALKLLDMDVIEMEQITERLKSDNGTLSHL